MITEDEKGFARFSGVSVDRPKGNAYVLAEVDYVVPALTKEPPSSNEWSKPGVHLALPFDRYYMEESDAPAAEKAYREHSRQGGERDAYVIVRVRKGQAVIEDLYVGGMPIREFLKYPNPK